MQATFSVTTFLRVFDTAPAREVLTLGELVACFRRFERKPQLLQKIERELGRIDVALTQALEGSGVGERVQAITLAGAEAERRGEPRVPAMRAKAEQLRVLARKDAKRDLRLWSPAVYRDDATERGSEGVSHVSCLVLDYDSGVGVREGTSAWSDFFHAYHTTWSHTPAHPKFRVILPLAVPVPVAQWDEFWEWAYARTAGEIDRALSGVAATYALPAVPHEHWPRDAGSHAAPLLDPRDLGIEVAATTMLEPTHRQGSPMLGDPEKEYLVHEAAAQVYVYDDDFGDGDGDDATLAPSTLAPSTLAPSTLAPSTLAPSTLAPSTLAPSTLAPSTLAPSTLAPSDTSAPSGVRAPVTRADGEATPAKRARQKKPTRKGRRKTIVVDFDGVLHSYVSGWQGATVIPDAPVAGAFAWLADAVERFDVAVLSARSREPGGIEAMRTWFRDHELPAPVLASLSFPRSKVPAHIYLDDRGWRFEGTFPPLEAIEAFRPWWDRGGSDE